jgi:hypothetical protein
MKRILNILLLLPIWLMGQTPVPNTPTYLSTTKTTSLKAGGTIKIPVIDYGDTTPGRSPFVTFKTKSIKYPNLSLRNDLNITGKLLWLRGDSLVTSSKDSLRLPVGNITGLSSAYQPLNAKLTAFSALANSAGLLYNNGSGVFSYAGISNGLSYSAGAVGLGGSLNSSTSIDFVNNTNDLLYKAGVLTFATFNPVGISLNPVGNIILSADTNATTFRTTRTDFKNPVKYTRNLLSVYDDRTHVDFGVMKTAIKDSIAAHGAAYIPLSGTSGWSGDIFGVGDALSIGFSGAANTLYDADGFVEFNATSGVRLTNAPANDDTLSSVLVRDKSSGLIKYRRASTLGGGGAVSSVFGRTGAVTAQSGDYTISQVTNGLSNSLNSGNIYVGSVGNVATPQTLSLNATGGSFGLGNTGILTIPNSDATTRGLLTDTDWNTFSNKLSSVIASVVPKSADFTVTTSDKSKIFDVTTGSTNINVTFPSAASAGNGFAFFVRKADTGTGLVLSASLTSSLAISGHMWMVWTDGTTWYQRHWHGNYSTSGGYTISAAANQNVTINLSGTGVLNIANLTTAGLLQNDASGNITTKVMGTGVSTFITTPSISALGTVLGSQSSNLVLASPVTGSGNISARSIDRRDQNNIYTEIGQVFNETWANLSNWTNVGTPSASVSSNKLSLGGTASWSTNYIRCSGYGRFNYEHALLSWTETVGTISSSSGGIAFSLQSQAVYSYSIQAHVDLTNTASQGKISWYYNNNGTSIQTSTRALVGLTAGYTIQHRLYLYPDKYVLRLDMYNGSTWVDGYEDALYINTGAGYSTIFANSAQFAFLNRGGNSSVGAFTVYSEHQKNPDLLILGNSITKGYSSTYLYNRYVSKAQQNYYAKIELNAQAGNTLVDFNTTEIAAYNPTQILIFGNTNKIAQSGTASALSELASFVTTLASLTTTAAPSGYSVANGNLKFATVLPRGSSIYQTFNSSLITTYGISNIVDFAGSLSDGTVDLPVKFSADGVHPNDYGHAIMADVLGNFFGWQKREVYSNTNIFSTADANTGYVGIGKNNRKEFALDVTDISGRSQIHVNNNNGSLTTTGGGGALTSNSDNQLYLTGGSYYDGSNFKLLSTVASAIVIQNGGITFQYASGTKGNTHTWTSSGNMNTSGNWTIGGNTGNARLSAIDVTSNSQINVYNSTGKAGGFITSNTTDQIYLSGGSYFNGTNWIATATTSSLTNHQNGTIVFQCNTGLTATNTFSPTTRMTLASTSLTLGSSVDLVGAATQNVFNSTSTTVNAFGAATSMTLGGTSTAAVTYNLGNNATATATTKTINIGTGGASGSSTNINLGSATSGASSKTTVNGTLVLSAFTVATLPAGQVGMTAYVTDATAPTYNSTVIGGGAAVVPVFYNGTNWITY